MISRQEILRLHELSIKEYGGADGIRDNGLLESAMARPFQTFDGNDLYASPLEKAAAIGESLIVNHPFIDGNKRTGLLGMYALLHKYGIRFTAKEENIYTFTIAISTGELDFDAMVTWLRSHTAAADSSAGS